MSYKDFALHLGGNLYLDSNGNLQYGPPPNAAIYEVPAKLPMAPKVFKDARDAVDAAKKALKDINKNEDLVKLFNKLEIADFLDLLSGAGKIAGVVMPAFVAAAFAIEVLKFFGVFGEEPSQIKQIEAMLEKLSEELGERLDNIELRIFGNEIDRGRTALGALRSAVKNKINIWQHSNLTDAQLNSDRQDLNEAHTQHITEITRLFKHNNWLLTLDPADHKLVWRLLERNLITMPEEHAERPAPLGPSFNSFIDHRLAVSIIARSALVYLDCLNGIDPEYRTTGEFRSEIQCIAHHIALFADKMRETVLARTKYSAADFEWPYVQLYASEVIDPLFGFGTAKISPTCNRWPVGALDLRYHDDTFFRNFLNELWRGWALKLPNQVTKHGLMDFRWIPPANLERMDYGIEVRYRITNPEECAEAANEQAERDYAMLLATSGYIELLQVATYLRHQTTDPSTSQTVKVGQPTLYYAPLPAASVVIESHPIQFSGEVITTNARRETMECLIQARVTTQPLKRSRPVEYRLMFRTLKSIDGGGWSETPYSRYQDVTFEEDEIRVCEEVPSPSNFLKTVFVDNPAMRVDEFQLIPEREGSPWFTSPRDGEIRLERNATLKAHTYDWWIPVDPPFSVDAPFETTFQHLRVFDLIREIDDISNNLPDTAHFTTNFGFVNAHFLDLLNDVASGFKWRTGRADWGGQRREAKEEQVSFDYLLRWQGDRLFVEIRNNPLHRNYVIFLVIEEKMKYSGQILHTAIPLPVNGQLTYVPREFFDKEFEAHAKTASIIADLVARYIPTVEEIRPSDPLGWIRPGDLANPDSLQRIVEHVKRNQTELLQQVMNEQQSTDFGTSLRS